MNENLNLCELLKGHEGETFYSTFMGDVTFLHIQKIGNPIVLDRGYTLSSDGKVNINGECMLFPSKDQRDWNKWAEEQKPKIPKTWKELCQEAQVEQIEVTTDVIIDDNDEMIDKSHAVAENIKLAKSALALLKIHQLIEIGYGGNITQEEWEDTNLLKYIIRVYDKEIQYDTYRCLPRRHVAFHTEKQAEEFLSYPENVQLVKDFYMI